ncbi:hypothetical protein DPMN_023396 [Dreissena polymorpha]|uniref:Uncharacterized protein n=1 Tax=Dreissena polymorpha TaxID=45954 RepID=A0A9D4LM65_DREPO|nr:hypothetical protein DPMN_023396 [Dreissena polymorpha]
MQTLRDRVLGKVHIDTVAAGRVPILSCEEESRLVDHLKSVATLGMDTHVRKSLALHLILQYS